MKEDLPDHERLERLQQLDVLLSKGKTFEEALDQVNPKLPAKRGLLWRLAFMRQFDRRLFDVVVRTTPAPAAVPSFEKIVATPGIDRVALAGEGAADDSLDGTFRVKDGFAAELLLEWVTGHQGQAEIRSLAASIWRYYQRSHQGTPLDRLRCQIAMADAASPAEQNSVMQAFEEAFAAAEADLALSQCHALVRMLLDLNQFVVGAVVVPLKLISPTLVARAEELGPYVALRGRFIEEHARSAHYMQRDKVWEVVEPFLGEQSGRWLLPIFGTGGRGKTIFLNWLIARYCVAGHPPIPVGRIDFDEINHAKLENRPDLLLLPLAEQLHRQIPALQDFLERWGHFAVILTPPTRVARGANIAGLEQSFFAADAKEIVETFAYKLGTVKRAVVLLDTLEEAMLHHPKALHQVIDMCRRVQAAMPSTQGALRVILSGRYNLRERGFLTEADPPPVEVPPLEYSERVKYLQETRGWREKNVHLDLVHAIARKADGNPFILSLVAGLVEDGSVKTLTDVAELQPEFAYLIDRVIRRIPESHRGVRWVIRYGVIPYRLTQEFLQQVMQKHLRRELSATDGGQDTLGLAAGTGQYAKYFPRGGELQFETLWTDLEIYASDYGWVRATKEEVRFQPEVVVPMTALLSTEKVFTELHRDARDYFRDKAASDPARWATWMAETLFHAAQLRDPELSVQFDALLADERTQKADGRREILDALTRSTFVDDEGAVRLDKAGEPLVPRRVVGLAFLELARLGAGIGFGPCRLTESESSVISWLERATRLLGMVDARGDIVRMSLALRNRRYDEVRSLAASLGEMHPQDMYAAHLFQSRAAATADPASHLTAIAHLDQAERLLPDDSVARQSFLEEKGEHLAAAGHFGAAVATFEEALSLAPPIRQAEGRSVLAEFLLDSAEYARVLEVVPRIGVTSTPQARRLARTWALAQVDQRAVLSTVPRELSPDMPELLEARGGIALAAGRIATGIGCLENAVLGYRNRGDLKESGKATLRLLRARLDLSGDLGRAERFLSDLDSLDDLDGFIRSQLVIERARLMLLRHTRYEESPVSEPWSVAAIRLIEGRSEHAVDEHLATLMRFLAQTESFGRRYDSLRFFKWVKTRPSSVADALLVWVPAPDVAHPDFLARALPLIDTLRALDKTREARTLLAQTIRQYTNRPHTAGRELILAALSLGADLPEPDAFGQSEGTAAIVVHIAYVLALIERGRADDAAAFQARIPETLPSELSSSLAEATNLENLSRLASARGEAGRLRAQSKDVRRHLGQDMAAVASRSGTFEATTSPGDTPSGTDVPTTTAATKGAAIAVSLRSLGDPAQAGPSRDLIPFEHVKLLLGSQPDVVRLMQSCLPAHRAPDADMRLVLDGGASSFLPWEWAVDGPALCYRASAMQKPDDGLAETVWPLLNDTVRRGLMLFRAVTVVVLQPAARRQERSRRGFERTSSRRLVDIYKTHGLRPTPSPLTADEFEETLTKLPNVVHLQLALIERYGLVRVVLGDDEASQLSVEAMLHLMPTEKEWRPTFILDPPRPSDDLETARQLLLRNSFAAELFASGRVRGVLATGLFDPGQSELCAERMAHSMAASPPLGQLLMLVQRDLGGDAFSSRGAALFVENPKTALS